MTYGTPSAFPPMPNTKMPTAATQLPATRTATRRAAPHERITDQLTGTRRKSPGCNPPELAQAEAPTPLRPISAALLRLTLTVTKK